MTSTTDLYVETSSCGIYLELPNSGTIPGIGYLLATPENTPEDLGALLDSLGRQQ